MTATTDFMTDTAMTTSTLSTPVRSLDGGRTVVRMARRITGAALILAAAGLWIAPGSNWTADAVLIKLVLSLVAGLVGLALVQSWSAPDTPEAEIDVVRRRVRLVRRTRRGDKVLQDCSFAELGRVENHKNIVTLWDTRGALLAEVAPTDRGTLRFLVSGLRDAGKL
ncbi:MULTISPECIES: hypothetical protein [Roseobacteraceae]|uniref:Uncharacterized protein n=1 Tax=Pseudosulfitobacter pseudonitzschiae TaxID=1402135 RepID=A0A221JYS6_9RHOB|nr:MULTISPECIES: hypothetical protein [Roseobacteraceae]ASM71905.1 hypothetical protein SULPSESMR1_01080 [Pseudosulfitobacter pseudonitzschiae]